MTFKNENKYYYCDCAYSQIFKKMAQYLTFIALITSEIINYRVILTSVCSEGFWTLKICFCMLLNQQI